MPKTCPRYVQDMPKICAKYTQDMPKICPKYAQDVPKICPRYAREICKKIGAKCPLFFFTKVGAKCPGVKCPWGKMSPSRKNSLKNSTDAVHSICTIFQKWFQLQLSSFYLIINTIITSIIKSIQRQFLICYRETVWVICTTYCCAHWKSAIEQTYNLSHDNL